MKIRNDFPEPVREIENAWIRLSDGTRLAARYWLPENADTCPVPAILEYIPYCKRDGTAARDEAMHPYFAGHGYAAVRVDMRGSGESDGLLDDEYLQRELDDAVEVIAWLAAQPWCTGRVGMMGKSWGGFNALQVAALRPPALTCIITVCSTDDRYADDVHYMGGCLNVANISWAFSMFMRNPRPPDPTVVGERWREMWRARLKHNRPWIIEWLSHQRRDTYWQHGSVCEDFTAIQCPVYAIGGWSDSYSNAIPRLMAGLKVPRKALIGPWGHQYPHQGHPGPAVGFLQDALRWWDHWLKEIDTGVMEEPAYRVWMQEFVKPKAFVGCRPGRWVAEQTWPSENIRETCFCLNDGELSSDPAPPKELKLRSPQSTGTNCLNWINNGTAGALDEPIDQREDDGRSLTFDTPPLDNAVEILGAPVVEVDVASDKPVAILCARICEVSPDGTSVRVTYGVLNLTHRESHASPKPLRPGESVRPRIQLNDIAYRFAPGSRIRLALSTAYWPTVWPAPTAATLTIRSGTSRLLLPSRASQPEDVALRDLPAAEAAPPNKRTVVRPSKPPQLEVRRDIRNGTVLVIRTNDAGRQRIDTTGWEYGSTLRRTLSIQDDDPLSARFKSKATVEFGRNDGPEVRIILTMTVSSDASHYHVEAAMEAIADASIVEKQQWTERIPRDHI